MPGARGAGRGVRPGRRSRAAAEHGRDARHQRLLDQLWTDEMDVTVEAPRREEFSLTGNDLRAWPDDHINAGLHVRIAGLADRRDTSLAQAHVGLDDAPVVEDHGVRDHGIDRAVRARAL